MNEWKKVKLGDVIQFDPQEHLPKSTVAKKVAMNCLSSFSRTITNFEIARYAGGSKFKNFDTIVARITPCLENGKTALIDFLEKDEVAFGSTEFIVLRKKNGLSDKKFIYYLSISEWFRAIAIKSMVGSSGRQRVQKDVLKETLFYLPELVEQRAIADVLSCLDDKIELNNKINKNLEKQAKALFKRWFVDFEFPNENGDPYKSSGGEMIDSELGLIPKEWKVGELRKVADITMGQSPAGTSFNTNKDGTIFFQGRGEFSVRFPQIRLYTTEPTRMASVNSVLLSVRAPVGDINVAQQDCCIGRGLASIKSNHGSDSYILYLLISLKQELDKYNGEGTVFGSINKEAFKALKIVIPRKSTIELYNSAASVLDREFYDLDKQNQKLVEMRDNLLPKLMNGEIRINF